MNRSTPGLPVHHQLLKFTQTHDHWVSDAIQPFHPLPSSSPPAFRVFPNIRVFSNESILRIRWPKYWSFSFSISSSNSGLISFSINWFDLRAVQDYQRAFSNTTVQKHQFFGTQLSLWSNSHVHTWPTGKTIALTRWIFVGKVLSLLFIFFFYFIFLFFLLFNMLSRFVIAFLPRSKCLLISWL